MQDQEARRGVIDAAAVVALSLMIIGVLFMARDLLVPLVLAVLLSFALAPLARFLQNRGLRRGFAVVAAVLAAFLALGALGLLITAEVGELLTDLPSYQDTVQRKIASLKGATTASGALQQVSIFLDNVGRELAAAAPDRTVEQPLKVQVQEVPPGPLDTIASLMEPLLHPFAMVGIVVIFVIFILLQREDLRNRFIKLVGTRDLQKTTAALDDAAIRLSRLLLIQLALNSGYGVVIGCGLWIIGVPIPVLWGILAAILRFVPYIGAVVGSALPLALAAAVDPGWTMLIWTAILFLATEPFVGHFIEPMAYGRTTGLSPVAVVVAATFWTWLWGPIGLLLSTPITVCLVVLGRHVKGLSFLEVLLGDRPALSAPEMFYQRALAGDALEIVAVAEKILLERSLADYYDRIALEGLRLAADDLEAGRLTETSAERVHDTVDEVIADLADYDDVDPVADRTDDPEAVEAIEEAGDGREPPSVPPEALRPGWEKPGAVWCVGAETVVDAAAAAMLAQLVGKHGLAAAAAGPDALVPRRLWAQAGEDIRAVCLVALSGSRPALLRFAMRRLRRRMPTARILLVLLDRDADAAAEDQGADAVALGFGLAVADLVAAGRQRLTEPEAPVYSTAQRAIGSSA